MRTIVAQLTANNQVAIRYVNRPNCLKGKNPGDNSAIKAVNLLAKYQKRSEDIINIIANAHIEYFHDNNRITYEDMQQMQCEGIYANIDNQNHTVKKYYKACKIPDVVEYVEVTGQIKRLVRTTRACLVSERLRVLDIIKLSQHRKKRERPWGKTQTLKSFTRNAKQKILEAGAVVDKHVGKEKSWELTLTIPGSGFTVYQAVSQWSGYLVNRLTQIIRRAEAKGIKCHWFFVWEHQKRGALHMHWCISVENSAVAGNLLALEMRSKWYELLEELSVKLGIDLFRKKGFLGTWRHSPDVWQSNIARVRKSVAAYFSKYCSKNVETSRFNRDRRDAEARLANSSADKPDRNRLHSLCPSRYWGCSSRTKQLCREYRVDLSFSVASAREGDFIYKALQIWISNVCGSIQEVSRAFKKIAPDTGFIYCQGWERKLWFKADHLDEMVVLFKRLRDAPLRKTDAIGAVAEMLSI